MVGPPPVLPAKTLFVNVPGVEFEALGISLIFVWDVYISEENWIIVQRGF